MKGRGVLLRHCVDSSFLWILPNSNDCVVPEVTSDRLIIIHINRCFHSHFSLAEMWCSGSGDPMDMPLLSDNCCPQFFVLRCLNRNISALTPFFYIVYSHSIIAHCG